MKNVILMYLFFIFTNLYAQEVVVQCGKLFDSKNAKFLEGRTIYITNGKISKISSQIDDLNASKNEKTQIIDLKNSYCMPGFIDLHVHLGKESNPNSYGERTGQDNADSAYLSIGYAKKTLLAGFTTVRDLGSGIATNLRNAIKNKTIEGPRVYAAGGIGTTGGHMDPTNGMNSQLTELVRPTLGKRLISGVDEGREAVRLNYKNSFDLIKIATTGGVLSVAKSGDCPQLTLEEIKSIVDTAKDYEMYVAAHAHGKEGMKRAILAGVKSIEHGTYMDDEIFSLMKKYKTWFVPTISAGKFVAEKGKIEGYYPKVVQKKALILGPLLQDTFSKAYKANVPIAFGTDSGVSYHGDNAQEFVFMVEAGMNPLEAIQTATLNAAMAIAPGVENEIGQIKENFYADIVAVKEDPSKNISVLKNISFVMKEGIVYKNVQL